MPYKPDRILLAISKDSNLFLTIEESKKVTWPSDLPALETPDSKFMYLEGKAAIDVILFFRDSSYVIFVDERGNSYAVSIHVVLPHENLLQPQGWVCSN